MKQESLQVSEVRSCLVGFYYLINYIIEGKENEISVKEAIDSTIAYLRIENDFYYDYESIDRILLVNIFEMCKSAFLTYVDKGIMDDLNAADGFIDYIFLQVNNDNSEKIKVFRNCLAHENYTFSGYMNIEIESCWGNVKLNSTFGIIDFYNFVRKITEKLDRTWEERNCIIEYLNDDRIVTSIDEAKGYIKDCINQSHQVANKNYIENNILLNDDFNRFMKLILSVANSDVKSELVRELNNYICEVRTNVAQSIRTFIPLFDFCETVRFYLNFDRQSCLEHEYALLYDNYFNYCIKYKKEGMYKPNFKLEWEEMNGEYVFYTNLDIRSDMEKELKEAIYNFSVFSYAYVLNEEKFFPYDKVKLICPNICTNDDLRRHLRNSAIHRNYRIENDILIFKDYNLRSKKLTFEGKLPYLDLKEAILSSYDYVSYYCPYY